jgi:hypothetical protein
MKTGCALGVFDRTGPVISANLARFRAEPTTISRTDCARVVVDAGAPCARVEPDSTVSERTTQQTDDAVERATGLPSSRPGANSAE